MQTSFQVWIDPHGVSYTCRTGETLLQGMLRLGRKGIPVGCVNGGCGVCKVLILAGQVCSTGPISRAHISEEEQNKGYTLACRAAPQGEVRLEVSARLRKPFGAVTGRSPLFMAPSKET